MEKLKCPECGNIVDASMAVCDKCGCPKVYFEKLIKNLKCPECGEIMLSNQECCPNCGCPMDYIIESNPNESELSTEERKQLAREKRKQRALERNKNNTTIDQSIEDSEKDMLHKLSIGELSRSIEKEQQTRGKKTTVLKVVGVTFENRQSKIINLIKDGMLFTGAKLLLKAEPTNQYDKYAVQVLSVNKVQIGYLPKEINREFSLKLQNGTKYDVIAEEITGGSVNYSYGVTIKIIEL